MNKTSFEIEIEAETLKGAQAIAEEKIRKFLDISEEELATNVDIELKVKNSEDKNKFKVVVFASVKRSILKI